MIKGKPLLIISTILIMSLCGFLILNSTFHWFGTVKNKDAGTASAMNNSKGSKNDPNKLPLDTYNPSPSEYDSNNEYEEDFDMENGENPWTPATEMDLNPDSITVLVNKEHTLSKNYEPTDLVIPNVKFDTPGKEERKHLRQVAATALETLFQAASQEGHTLYGISGYRSYNRQKQIFTSNIVKKGKNYTLKYSAVPGASEHQTGLAMDVSTKSMRFRLVTGFAKSNEGIWLAENAHHFGFIIRYGQNQEDITGYAYEPWHIRYVGKNLAKYLFENHMTLEEYYNYTPSPDFDFESTYAELINYKPPITPDDLDGDGIHNSKDDDIDGDGIPNSVDDDIDGDGILNEKDDDMDGDGIPNTEDDDMDGDGVLNSEDPDMDGDGILNEKDDDMDGDGIPNSIDPDIDGDGIPNTEDDDMDGDGIPNSIDPDMDGDGILNHEDPDMDGDGVPNTEDDDIDGDGIPNELDDDMDGDGVLNHEDRDMDGNGIFDTKDPNFRYPSLLNLPDKHPSVTPTPVVPPTSEDEITPQEPNTDLDEPTGLDNSNEDTLSSEHLDNNP